MSFKTASIFVLLAVVNVGHSINYCTAPEVLKACGVNVTHIGCNNPGFPVSTTCQKPKFVMFTQSQIAVMLDAHNLKRNLVASGKATNTSAVATAFVLPAASNMKAVTWNVESARLAGLNTLQCKMDHDKCRYNTVYNGQNLYSSSTTSKTPLATEGVIRSAVNAWYNEINRFDQPQIDSFTGANGVGHFTQVVWAETTQIGCGMSTWYDGVKWYSYLVACNYLKGGNMLGGSIYKKGAAAATCPSARSPTYTSLCL